MNITTYRKWLQLKCQRLNLKFRLRSLRFTLARWTDMNYDVFLQDRDYSTRASQENIPYRLTSVKGEDLRQIDRTNIIAAQLIQT